MTNGQLSVMAMLQKLNQERVLTASRTTVSLQYHEPLLCHDLSPNSATYEGYFSNFEYERWLSEDALGFLVSRPSID